jgi:hypothetical protein
MDVFPKFIVEGNNLIIGKCTYHKQLATNTGDVKGGGWWKWKREEREMHFYGESADFGPAIAEDIKACIVAGNVFLSYAGSRRIEGHTFYLKTGCETIKL